MLSEQSQTAAGCGGGDVGGGKVLVGNGKGVFVGGSGVLVGGNGALVGGNAVFVGISVFVNVGCGVSVGGLVTVGISVTVTVAASVFVALSVETFGAVSPDTKVLVAVFGGGGRVTVLVGVPSTASLSTFSMDDTQATSNGITTSTMTPNRYMTSHPPI